MSLFLVACGASAVQALPQLPLLLHHLELQSLDAIAQCLFSLSHGPGAKLVLAFELAALFGLDGRGGWARIRMRDEAALLQVGLGLEGLNAAVLALNLGVGAGEQEGDVGADFVA